MSHNFFPKRFFISIVLMLIGQLAYLQNAEMNDGPYIDNYKDSLRLRWIEKGVPKDSLVAKSQATIFKKDKLPVVDLKSLEISEELIFEYPHVEKYVVVGDPHGQFDKVYKLLQASKVVDSLGRWIFEDNHLVVMGDYFSRGDKVIELLWFLFDLEKQAKEANGHIHFLIGNHEMMTFSGDLRYLHKKYLYTSGALKSVYNDLFNERSILGNWLKSKNIGIILNDNLLIHAGASMDLVRNGFDLEKLNNNIRNNVYPNLKDFQKLSVQDQVLVGDNGPFWYRGYSDTTGVVNETIIDSILKFYNVDHVTVGHTIKETIHTKFSNKVIFVDMGLFTGNEGQVLRYNDDKYYYITSTGERKVLFEHKQKKKRSLFDHVYKGKGTPVFTIKTNMKSLVKNKMKEVYQDATLEFVDNKDSMVFKTQIRARGNMRKQVCFLPPVKFKFDKTALADYNLKSADKLKLVFPCKTSDFNNEKLLQEYYLYTLYKLVDSNSVRAKVVDVIIQEDKDIDKFKALCIEDEESYSIRKSAQLLPEKGVISSSSLERTPFLRMYFFQYMIANTDWSVGNRHNLLITKLKGNNRVTALPYDFDYSGFVNQTYAVPHESLPIKSVTERHFMSYTITEAEFLQTVDFFLSKKDEILEHARKADYLKPKTISENISFLESFFKELNNPKRLRSSLKIQ